MTRASTSAANFGLLLVALVLMLHPVMGELTSRHIRHHLFAREDSNDKCHTDLVANYQEYKTRCEDNNDPQKTCFTHWAGDLKGSKACLRAEGDVRKKLMIKDDTMTDFTIDKPADSFQIWYPKLGGVSLSYDNFDSSTGCKDITIQRGKNLLWNIWVSDEDGDDKDIDALNHSVTSKRLCSKWIHIHISSSFWNL
ncbi:related to Mig1 protein [Ustilago bromivora]|uniref:Related to Mig1 protein n=1 Tax=Ustilago bromivora TaxID=307758 RepID=A0A1K0HD89_9BASI|nr:related to Mig1 protein [Ustilago bromivora]